MKQRIIIFTTSYHPFIGGAEIAVEEIAKRLSPTFDFFIMTARRRRDLLPHEVRPEGTILRLGFGRRIDKWLFPFFAFWYCARYLKQSGNMVLFAVDISHASAFCRFYAGEC
jgi:hypothetical protein